MEHKRMVGMTVKALSNHYKRLMDVVRPAPYPEGSKEAKITGMQYGVMRYVCENMPRGDVYQRDIERVFNIRRSTATGILQLMEQRGLIVREAVAQDGRLKRILPTKKTLCAHEEIQDLFEHIENEITKGLSQEELTRFFATSDVLLRNMKALLEEGRS